MTTIAWILLIVGAVINYLVPPICKKAGRELPEQALYIVKTFGLVLVIIGAAMIFVAGGKVDVNGIR